MNLETFQECFRYDIGEMIEDRFGCKLLIIGQELVQCSGGTVRRYQCYDSERRTGWCTAFELGDTDRTSGTLTELMNEVHFRFKVGDRAVLISDRDHRLLRHEEQPTTVIIERILERFDDVIQYKYGINLFAGMNTHVAELSELMFESATER